jgi:hypothetical protein
MTKFDHYANAVLHANAVCESVNFVIDNNKLYLHKVASKLVPSTEDFITESSTKVHTGALDSQPVLKPLNVRQHNLMVKKFYTIPHRIHISMNSAYVFLKRFTTIPVTIVVDHEESINFASGRNYYRCIKQQLGHINRDVLKAQLSTGITTESESETQDLIRDAQTPAVLNQGEQAFPHDQNTSGDAASVARKPDAEMATNVPLTSDTQQVTLNRSNVERHPIYVQYRGSSRPKLTPNSKVTLPNHTGNTLLTQQRLTSNHMSQYRMMRKERLKWTEKFS